MTFHKTRRTDALLARMGFWQGMLSAFHLFGNYYRTPYAEQDALQLDRQAMEADWGAVGDGARVCLDDLASADLHLKPGMDYTEAHLPSYIKRG